MNQRPSKTSRIWLAMAASSLAGSGVLRAQTCQSHWEAWTSGGIFPGYLVDSLAASSSPSGPVLYASGNFGSIAGMPVGRIAAWDGHTWSPLGAGVSGVPGSSPVVPNITSLVFYSDGTGNQLYAGGWFVNAGDQVANGIARWNGATWSTFAPGLAGSLLPQINAMLVFDDGSGSALYVSGIFTSIAGINARGIARWNGVSWQPVGDVATSLASPQVYAMVAFDDGNGPALYAGGTFSSIGGVPAVNIAKWNGNTWQALGNGLGVGPVDCLAAYDEGLGLKLFAAGEFAASGSTPVSLIARWDAGAWSPVGGGLTGTNPFVECLQVFDDGTGAALYAGGQFSTAGGQPAHAIVRWNGSTWSGLGQGIDGFAVFSMTPFNDGSGTALYVGGEFSAAGGVAAPGLARWTRCPECTANCDRSSQIPVLNANDFQCFLNKFAAGDNYANCDNSTVLPILNANDFQCFLSAFAAGCT